MATALFDAGAVATTQNKLQFRAGKMNYNMSTKEVTPDPRRGLCWLERSTSPNSNGLILFHWKPRAEGSTTETVASATDDTTIIFPDNVEFRKVTQCTTGRVYVLRFKNSSKREFFWMQEPDADKDEEICKKVNEAFVDPFSLDTGRRAAPRLGGMDGRDLLEALSGAQGGGPEGFDMQQFLQTMMGGSGSDSAAEMLQSLPHSLGESGQALEEILLGDRTSTTQSGSTSATSHTVTTTVAGDTSRPSTATSTVPPVISESQTTSTSSQGPGIQLSDLSNILAQIQSGTPEPKTPINLADALKPECMIPLLANEEVRNQLIPFLPAGIDELPIPQSESELSETIHSPQFRQSLEMFSAALASGEIGPLMSQFGLGAEVVNAAMKGDVEDFCKAMQATYEKKDETSVKSEKFDKKDEASTSVAGNKEETEKLKNIEQKKTQDGSSEKNVNTDKTKESESSSDFGEKEQKKDDEKDDDDEDVDMK